MASVELASPYSGFQGAAGSPLGPGRTVTWRTNKFGFRQYARLLVTPSNPQSTAQDLVRAAMTAASVAYSQVGAATASLWEAAATLVPRSNFFGVSATQGGKGLYCSVNILRLLDGQAQSSTVPDLSALAAPSFTNNDASWDPGVTDFTLPPFTHSSPAGAFFLVRVSFPLTGLTRVARRTDMRMPTTVAANAIIARAASPQTIVITDANVRADLNAAYDAIGSGNTGRIGVEITSLNSEYVPFGKTLANNVTLTFP